MNEVVKYHNDLNTAVMRRWTKEEMNFFFAIIAKVRGKGTSEIVFDLSELKDLVAYAERNNKRFLDIMKSLALKLNSLAYIEQNEETLKIMSIFQEFEIDNKGTYLRILVSQKFEYIINEVLENWQFTSFELAQFAQLKSTYSKTMYRLLKQWRTLGRKTFPKNELFKLLDVPKSMQRPNNFADKVLKHIKQELPVYFEGFKVTPIKSSSRGTPITGYEFSWKAEKTGEWKDFDKLEKNRKKKPVRSETVPENILAAEKEDEERKKKLQEEFFQKAMQLRDQSFEDQAQLFSEARKVDTYRMPNATQFLDTLATLMDFDLKKYWDPILKNAQSEGEENG
ncbi:replication initiation protein [Enterococcus ureasiticus]|uniref:replication initiation protein n=1 Tax=Enterococcus ureasiticus TaxID=903984 RepID=UPI001A8DDD52|nr:replication initiation protein [Enterococcus ureasiticus]MBO0472238.1 replication initiation protein [Enterococcus ureasiticus]